MVQTKKLARYALVASATLLFMSSAPTLFAQQSSSTTHIVLVGGSNAHLGLLYDEYAPSTIVIRAGDTVVWKDVGGPHTVTSVNTTSTGSPLFDSSSKFTLSPQFAAAVFGPGGYTKPGTSFVLDTSTLAPGTYKYQCTIHDMLGMVGYLTVTSATASPDETATVTMGWTQEAGEVTMFNPQNVTVAQGTHVIFQSLAGQEPHDVVSETKLSNGTVILGKYFDSSPRLVPPGISEAALVGRPPPFPIGPGGMMLPPSNFNYTFAQPGTYLYYCKIHSSDLPMMGPMPFMHMAGMTGEVIVLPSYATQQQVDALNSQVGASENGISSLNSNTSYATNIAYIALGFSVLFGIAALALSRRRAS
ncbi:MAG: hypothetical protein KGI38_03920 [Thaumarchaeota archaeon]|nr:hypothetical protein [Nitrososphaerota archaeon]